MEEPEKKLLSRRRSTVLQQPLKVKDERIATVKKVTTILQKSENSRTSEECDFLLTCSDIVKEVNLRQEKRDKVKARLEEVEDAPELLEEKCIRLAAAISRATSLTVYTGAGISTAASIPDYRGTNGVWTRMQQGKDIGNHDLSQAEPTLTHMALYSLYKAGILKYIVSQNCDGLHLRSGIPRNLLSEVHGNMYVEVCRNCKPSREYWRLFDVTEKTARYAHATGRTCHKCNSALQDSIVHFGERGNLLWPINWNGACRAAKQADVILCLGSSLKVLKRYPWLWQMDKPASKRSQLYIVNLQWTPKDENAVLKINGKCDKVMKIVMSHLGIDIPNYDRSKDPIFYHAIKLQPHELSTTSNPFLELPSSIIEENESIIENKETLTEEKENIEYKEMIDEEKNMDITGDIVENEETENGNGVKLDDIMEDEEKENVIKKEDFEDDEVETIEDFEESDQNDHTSLHLTSQTMLSEELTEKNEAENCASMMTFQEPIAAYPAPFFAALPFLSMGLPFPPLYVYPQLTPIFYYNPFIQIPSNDFVPDICPVKPKPACAFCMENEGSLTCLYYQRYIDVDDSVGAELEVTDVDIQDDSDKIALIDENTATATAKNPGWFGKGYRKGMKRKR